MKVQIQMKTNDCLYYAGKELEENEQKEFKELCERWFEYGECVTLEVDTEKETIEVLPA